MPAANLPPARTAEDFLTHWNYLPSIGYFVLSVEPLIVLYNGSYQHLPDYPVPPLPAGMRPDVVIEMMSWVLSPSTAEQVARRYDNQRDGVRRMLMVNVPVEDAVRRAVGIDGFRCHKEIFALSDIFRPEPAPTCHDAVYVARLAAFKRHQLASAVPNLHLLTGGLGEIEWNRPNTRASVDDLGRLGMHPTTTACLDYLDAAAVARAINRSRCGLALSAVEGIMRASTQYLMCGRPVVSTRSIGGRDFFYDEYTAVMVDDDPRAVADAVAQLREEPRDSAEIRRRTMNRIRHERYRFATEVARLCREAGSHVAPESIYCELFGDYLRLARRYRRADLSAPAIDADQSLRYTSGPASIGFPALDEFGIEPAGDGWTLTRGGAETARLDAPAAWLLSRLLAGDEVAQLVAQVASRSDHAEDEVRDSLAALVGLGVVDFTTAAATGLDCQGNDKRLSFSGR